MNLYDTSALFGQNMADKQQKRLEDFYKRVFGNYHISTIHDCSIGAGGTTLPLAKLGYVVSGSDISDNLLKRAEINFQQEGYLVDLFNADFRTIGDQLLQSYDCIMSSGNSLAHVNNEDVYSFIRGISDKISNDGLIYIDMRNWDKILDERPIFSTRDPLVMNEKEHKSLYQIWNWHDDNSVDFIFATSTDKEGRHVETSFTYAPTYYPLRLLDLEKMLNEFGFEIRTCFDVDDLWISSSNTGEKTGDFSKDFNNINWYAILAQKVR